MVNYNEKNRKRLAADKYIKSLHSSEVRLKDILKINNSKIERKVKIELDK
jgi:hypothetical protein